MDFIFLSFGSVWRYSYFPINHFMTHFLFIMHHFIEKIKAGSKPELTTRQVHNTLGSPAKVQMPWIPDRVRDDDKTKA
jgi:hypothetical protein